MPRRTLPARTGRGVGSIFGLTLLLAAFFAGAAPVWAQDAGAAPAAPDDQATTLTVEAGGDATTDTVSPVAGLDPAEARRLTTKPETKVNPEDVALPLSAERKRLARLRETLTPAQMPEAALRIRALEGDLEYDEEDQIIYGPGRTRIRYGRYYLEADKVIMDVRLQEVQAEGNVILKITDQSEITADSIRYNFRDNEGAAYHVNGAYPPVYFRSTEKGTEPQTLPQFQKVSRDESIFRNTQVTTCDFKVPHYYIRGREVVFFQGDRLFFRGATFYVWGTPVFYFPVYSRSLAAGSPWSLSLGYNSRTGTRARLGYTYHHQTAEPSLDNESEFETRHRGTANVYADYLSKIGPGLGFDYDYSFDFGRHEGALSLYGITDKDREVTGATFNDETLSSESDRWRLKWQHRTQITQDLDLMFNVDEFSDPDIFYDVLDLFNNDLEARDRQVTRRGRGALTFVQEEYVARLMVETKDRIGLDKYYNFSDPTDDNYDFDLAPGQKLGDDDTDGIGRDRWGRVSMKLPQFDLASRYLPLDHQPLYWTGELHAYNNLDKGLNTVSSDDDDYVQGGEFYQRLLRQWKLSERYTLLGKVGVGVGGAERNDQLGLSSGDYHFDNGYYYVADDFDQGWRSLRFIDRDGTFLIGERERNLSDIEPFYAWSDEELLFNARFSDALTGKLRWRARQTTDDFIGDWYASLGSLTFREDLYNYPIRENWLEGQLAYTLFRPMVTLSTSAGYNMLNRDEVYANEPLAYWSNGVSWSNQRQTLQAGAGVGLSSRQIYDPSDPDAFEQTQFGVSANARYSPIHQRWYAALRGYRTVVLNDGVEDDDDEDFTYFTDEDPTTRLRMTYGRKLGPKYDTELMTEWDEQVGGVRKVAWLLQRDLHDAIAVLRVGLDNDEDKSDSRNDQENQLDVRLGLKLKLPNQNTGGGNKSIRTLRDREHEPAFAE